MSDDIRHNDQFFNSLKDSLEEWQPDFSPEEMVKEWGSVKSNIIKPTKPFFSPKNILYTTISTVAVVTGVVLYTHFNTPSSGLEESVAVESIEENVVIEDQTSEENILSEEKTDHSKIFTEKSEDNLENELVENKINEESVSENSESSESVSPKDEIKLIRKREKKENEDPENIHSYYQPLIADNVDVEFPQKIIFCSSRKPKENEIVISDTVVCLDEPLKINSVSSKSESALDIKVHDSYYSDVNGVLTYKFNKPGDYNIVLSQTENSKKSETSVTVHVEPNPRANFSYDDSETPVFSFKNKTRGAVWFAWNFGDNNVSLSPCPKYKYYDTGRFMVTLIATSEHGCKDTIAKTVHAQVFPEIDFTNVITPNGDGANDEFRIIVSGESYFDLIIYDRNYTLVFASKEKDVCWKGNYNNSEKPCPSGTYFYKLEYRFIGSSKLLRKVGTVTLSR